MKDKIQSVLHGSACTKPETGIRTCLTSVILGSLTIVCKNLFGSSSTPRLGVWALCSIRRCMHTQPGRTPRPRRAAELGGLFAAILYEQGVQASRTPLGRSRLRVAGGAAPRDFFFSKLCWGEKPHVWLDVLGDAATAKQLSVCSYGSRSEG